MLAIKIKHKYWIGSTYYLTGITEDNIPSINTDIQLAKLYPTKKAADKDIKKILITGESKISSIKAVPVQYEERRVIILIKKNKKHTYYLSGISRRDQLPIVPDGSFHISQALEFKEDQDAIDICRILNIKKPTIQVVLRATSE